MPISSVKRPLCAAIGFVATYNQIYAEEKVKTNRLKKYEHLFGAHGYDRRGHILPGGHKVFVTIRMKPRVAAKLRRLASKNNVSQNQLIRLLIAGTLIAISMPKETRLKFINDLNASLNIPLYRKLPAWAA